MVRPNVPASPQFTVTSKLPSKPSGAPVTTFVILRLPLAGGGWSFQQMLMWLKPLAACSPESVVVAGGL